jgi:hypothetical protein
MQPMMLYISPICEADLAKLIPIISASQEIAATLSILEIFALISQGL